MYIHTHTHTHIDIYTYVYIILFESQGVSVDNIDVMQSMRRHKENLETKIAALTEAKRPLKCIYLNEVLVIYRERK